MKISSNPYCLLASSSGNSLSQTEQRYARIQVTYSAFKQSCHKHPNLTKLLITSIQICLLSYAVITAVCEDKDSDQCEWGTNSLFSLQLMQFLSFAAFMSSLGAFCIKSRKQITEWRKQYYSHIPRNKKKVALIVESTSDHNGSFTMQGFPRELETGYQPVFKKVSSLEEVYRFAYHVRSRHNVIRMLWIEAHGWKNGLELGEEYNLTVRKRRQFAQLVKLLHPSAIIVFSACLAGAPGGLASRLAICTRNRTIYASRESFNSGQVKVSCQGSFKFSIKCSRWGGRQTSYGKIIDVATMIFLMFLPIGKLKQPFLREIGIRYQGSKRSSID